MVNGIRRVVIWAHSECRSNAALYAAVRKRAAEQGIAVKIYLWNQKLQPESRKIEIEDAVVVGEDYAKGLTVLREFGGPDSVQAFCVYQNSSVWRRLIAEAKRGGARVVVNAEAPCEMCLGVKATLKRLYYRFVLPWKLRAAVHAADLFINASGETGIDRLVRLGWKREKIVPFGYASPRLVVSGQRLVISGEGKGAVSGQRLVVSGDGDGERVVSGQRLVVREEKKEDSVVNLNLQPQPSLRVLHLGSEASYRGVKIAEKAARIAGVELVKTGGKMPEEELVAEIRRADVVVACGYCEPWGMRMNDVLLEGTPIIVSDGMGVAAVCGWYGCGCVVPKGDAAALAKVLKRCKDEPEFLAKLRSGAQVAAEELLPENRAKVWLELVVSG